jgi:hypothetical protein
VPRPRDVVSIIDSYQGQFNKSQKERNLEDTLQLLHSYHELQQEDGSEEAASQDATMHTNNGSKQNAGQALSSEPGNRDEALLQNLLHNEI